MASLWPWLTVAGIGALHGLSPANGWMFAAACGVRSGDASRARRALLPIALGHMVSVAVVSCVAAQGLSLDRDLFRSLAGALLVGAASYRMLHGAEAWKPVDTLAATRAGLALWSFLMATAHGAGLMLVPALVPLCLSDGPAREIGATGSLLLACTAVAVHTAAMLATTGVLAVGVSRRLSRRPAWLCGAGARQAWTAVLGATGIALMALG
jgi:hypothetical protein